MFTDSQRVRWTVGAFILLSVLGTVVGLKQYGDKADDSANVAKCNSDLVRQNAEVQAIRSDLATQQNDAIKEHFEVVDAQFNGIGDLISPSTDGEDRSEEFFRLFDDYRAKTDEIAATIDRIAKEREAHPFIELPEGCSVN